MDNGIAHMDYTGHLCHVMDTHHISTGGGGGPFQPLKTLFEAVADTCLVGGEEETERVLGQRGPLLSDFFPRLANRSCLGGLAYFEIACWQSPVANARRYRAAAHQDRAVPQRY